VRRQEKTASSWGTLACLDGVSKIFERGDLESLA
jgi:hypothetical protein